MAASLADWALRRIDPGRIFQEIFKLRRMSNPQRLPFTDKQFSPYTAARSQAFVEFTTTEDDIGDPYKEDALSELYHFIKSAAAPYRNKHKCSYYCRCHVMAVLYAALRCDTPTSFSARMPCKNPLYFSICDRTYGRPQFFVKT